MLRLLVLIVCFFGFAFSVSASEGSKPTQVAVPAKKSPAVDQQLLGDLARIRRQMGGSVLNGSMLEGQPQDTENAFQDGIQTLIEQADPEPAMLTPKFDQAEILPRLSELRLVKSLREQCVKLEQVANQLEHLKQYKQADDLRDSAGVLRQLARSFDVPAAKATSTKIKNAMSSNLEPK